MTTPQNEEQHPAQKREELTEEERAALESGMCRGGMKALRIVDAHAADRARLVARVAELERGIERLTYAQYDGDKRVAEAEAEVARLRQRLEVAERNEAWLRKDRDTQVGNARADRAAAESELAAANALLGRIGVWADTYGAAIVPHGEALEAEKREANAAFCLEVQLRQAAEAQVAELEDTNRMQYGQLQFSREQLAAANAEVERWKGLAHGETASRQALGGLVRELRAEAAELRAKVKTAAEQRVLDACRDAQLTCWDGADGMMGESLYVIIQAELARREEAPRG